MRKTLRVALFGTSFMGRAHAHAWRTAARFFDLPFEPELAVAVGRNADRTMLAADKYGFAEASTCWRKVVQREDIDVVDICTPGDLHADMAIAALEADKHVLCEKPLAIDVTAASQMVDAAIIASERGVRSMCGFNYRRTPALALGRQLVEEGRLGEIRQVRAQYLQDWLSNSQVPMSWKLDSRRAGSGALGDILTHSVDLAQWMTGQPIIRVSAALRTFVKERPLLDETAPLEGQLLSDVATGQVTVDDAVALMADLSGGRSRHLRSDARRDWPTER